jgi:hypothetical protein
MTSYARIVDGSVVEVWDDGGLGIAPADVFVPVLAGQFEPVPDEVRAGWSLANGVWTAPLPAPEPAPDWPALIAERRYRAETAGIVVNGMSIDTSRDSQSLITGAALQATIDSTYTCRWKTASGFVDLSAAQILALAAAVRAHVQACFDREAELLGEVEAGTFTADLLEQGWPQ